MLKVDIYNLEGQKIGERELNPRVFGVAAQPSLIQQVASGLLANQRQVLAHTKTRGEVRGGGKKPWKQKGTGRARHGSIRSPLWRGGGVIFGPRSDRNFKVKINKKMRRAALLMSLSDKVKTGSLVVLEKLELAQPKTKVFVNLLSKLPVAGRKVLLLFPEPNPTVYRSSRNLAKVRPQNLNEINLLDVLGHEVILTPVATLDRLEKIYAK